MVVDLFLDVARVGQLHDYAQSLCFVVEEGFSVVDDVGVGDGGEYPDFVERVLPFFFAHLSDFDLGVGGVTFFMA